MKHFFPIFITALLTYSNTTNAITASSPQNISGVKTVSTQEAKELYDDGVLFVDVRLDSDWEKGRVPEALHLNIASDLTANNLLKEITKSDDVVFYCNGKKCYLSAEASKRAVEWGFTSIFYYRDGLPEWEKSGYPVERTP